MKRDKVIFDIFELQILIDIRNLFSLCRQIAVKGKIIFERDAGFFLYVVILENNQKFVKKKKNAYTAITISLINGKWEPQTVSSSNKLPQ